MLHNLSFALLFAVLTCGQIASPERIRKGECFQIVYPPTFDWDAFSGIWYEQRRYGNPMEGDADCVFFKYTMINETRIKINIEGIGPNKKPLHYDGIGKIEGPAMFFTDYESGLKRGYQILGTDYTSWAAIYNCHNDKATNNSQHYDTVWALTRKRMADDETIDKAVQNLTQYGFPKILLRETEQDPKYC